MIIDNCFVLFDNISMLSSFFSLNDVHPQRAEFIFEISFFIFQGEKNDYNKIFKKKKKEKKKKEPIPFLRT